MSMSGSSLFTRKTNLERNPRSYGSSQCLVGPGLNSYGCHHHHHHHQRHSYRRPWTAVSDYRNGPENTHRVPSGSSRRKWNKEPTKSFFIAPSSVADRSYGGYLRSETKSDRSTIKPMLKEPEMHIAKSRPHDKIKPKKKRNDKCRIFLGMDFPAERFLAPVPVRKLARKGRSSTANPAKDRFWMDSVDSVMPRDVKKCFCMMAANSKYPNPTDFGNGTRNLGDLQPVRSASLPIMYSDDRVQRYQCKLDELHKKKLDVNVEDPLFCRPQKRHFPAMTKSTIFRKPSSKSFSDDVTRDTILSVEGMTLMSRKKFPRNIATAIDLV